MIWHGVMGVVMWLWLLIGVALLVALVLAIVWLVRQLRASPHGATGISEADPLRAVEVRYARGEIDRDSYLAIRDDLRER